MPYRLLHLADLHLDTPFAAAGCGLEVAQRRRQGLRDALRRAGEQALASECDAITIAGDLYEHERAGSDTEAFLQDLVAGWPLPVLIAPGNHDSLLPGSLYRRAAWPGNVHVFSSAELTPLRLRDGLTLWGLGHPQPAWQGDPLGGDAPLGDGVHLALFHGAELGSRPPGKAIHGPFHALDIRRRGFAVALCGHYHRRRIDVATGLLYPGSPEPLSADETEPRGPIIVDVRDDGQVSTTALDLNRWRAVCGEVELGGCGSTAAVEEALLAGCTEALGDADPDLTVARLDLTGELDPAVSLDSLTLGSWLRERSRLAAVSVRNRTTPRLDLEVLGAERSARGAFVAAVRRQLESAADEQEATALQDALRFGLAALAGSRVGLG